MYASSARTHTTCVCVGGRGWGGQVGAFAYISPSHILSLVCIRILNVSATQDANPLTGLQ